MGDFSIYDPDDIGGNLMFELQAQHDFGGSDSGHQGGGWDPGNDAGQSAGSDNGGNGPGGDSGSVG